MLRRLIIPGALLLLATAIPASAQIKLDVAKITCRQYLLDKNFIHKAPAIATWLSGYINGKNDNTIVDIGTMAKNKDKVEDYCRLHLEVTLIDAANTALKDAK